MYAIRSYYGDDPGQPNTDDPTLIVTGSNGTGGTGIFKTYWDINGGSVNPGDVLEYTVTAINTNTEKAVEMSFTDEISGFIHLVAGTVGTTQGVVLTGNADSDTAVSVSLGAVAPGGQAEVSFQVKVVITSYSIHYTKLYERRCRLICA